MQAGVPEIHACEAELVLLVITQAYRVVLELELPPPPPPPTLLLLLEADVLDADVLLPPSPPSPLCPQLVLHSLAGYGPPMTVYLERSNSASETHIGLCPGLNAFL